MTEKQILYKAFIEYRNAREQLIASKPKLKLMYTRLERRETFLPGSYLNSWKDLENSIDTKNYVNDIENKMIDITDAWNCKIITGDECDELSQLISDYQENRTKYFELKSNL